MKKHAQIIFAAALVGAADTTEGALGHAATGDEDWLLRWRGFGHEERHDGYAFDLLAPDTRAQRAVE